MPTAQTTSALDDFSMLHSILDDMESAVHAAVMEKDRVLKKYLSQIEELEVKHMKERVEKRLPEV
jgi:hypothetical protein